jgi:hypothetical protein
MSALTPSDGRSPAGKSSSTVHGFTRPRTERPPTTLPPYAARRYSGRPPPRNRTKRASIAFPGLTGSKASQPGTRRLAASLLKWSKASTSKRSTRTARGTGLKGPRRQKPKLKRSNTRAGRRAAASSLTFRGKNPVEQAQRNPLNRFSEPPLVELVQRDSFRETVPKAAGRIGREEEADPSVGQPAPAPPRPRRWTRRPQLRPHLARALVNRQLTWRELRHHVPHSCTTRAELIEPRRGEQAINVRLLVTGGAGFMGSNYARARTPAASALNLKKGCYSRKSHKWFFEHGIKQGT